jgi:hypothetical protein
VVLPSPHGRQLGQLERPVRVGPFFVDAVAPTNPTLSSPSHVVGTPSLDTTIDVEVAGASDAASGVDGYSVSFTRSPAQPDTVKDAEEPVNTLTSRSLEHGWDWYANLRTGDNAGNWSTATSLGPFRLADNAKPLARALASSGRRGTLVKLLYRVSDNSGQTRERIRVYRSGRLLKTIWMPLAPTVAGQTYYVRWRAPLRRGWLRFCVVAWDGAGNASATSCNSLRIT